MAHMRLLKEHRSWEDWLGIFLGVLAGLSPWFALDLSNPMVTLNAMAIGVLVVALASFELLDQERWEEVIEFACGAWLVASPFIFGYAGSGQLRFWHFAIGAVVIGLALVELRQPRNLST